MQTGALTTANTGFKNKKSWEGPRGNGKGGGGLLELVLGWDGLGVQDVSPGDVALG